MLNSQCLHVALCHIPGILHMVIEHHKFYKVDNQIFFLIIKLTPFSFHLNKHLGHCLAPKIWMPNKINKELVTELLIKESKKECQGAKGCG